MAAGCAMALLFTGSANASVDALSKLRIVTGKWSCHGYWLDAKANIVSQSSDAFTFDRNTLRLSSVDSVPTAYVHEPLIFARSQNPQTVAVYGGDGGPNTYLGEGHWLGSDFEVKWKHSTSTLKLLTSKTIEWVTPRRTNAKVSRTWIDWCKR